MDAIGFSVKLQIYQTLNLVPSGGFQQNEKTHPAKWKVFRKMSNPFKF